MSQSSNQRILSIDVFRGITILVMVFVNELAGIANIPDWMKHMPADADAMTFVDLVFPAFLFIVGMSIPFAIKAKRDKGANPLDIFKHASIRALGLIVIGFYMVNSIGGFDPQAMDIHIHLWTLLMYFAVLATWCTLPRSWISWKGNTLRAVGVFSLLILALMYKGTDGNWMTPQWWGILGLIGWAYIISVIVYLIAGSNNLRLTLLSIGFVGLFAIFEQFENHSGFMGLMAQENRNNTHVVLVLAGLILSNICFSQDRQKIVRNIGLYLLTTGLLALCASFIWPISKIWATPSWSLISVFCCGLLFAFIFWVVEVKEYKAWCKWFEPAANNPLLIYILPYILIAGLGALGWASRPDLVASGVLGIIWSALFAVVMMYLVTVLNKIGIRLKL